MLIKKQLHWPSLNTVIMVEKAIKNSEESITSLASLKKKLPRQVNHNTLKLILEYLEQSNKIFVSMKGITWIHNNNRKLQQAIGEGFEL